MDQQTAFALAGLRGAECRENNGYGLKPANHG
jgi:hypothetical protein